MNVKAHLADLLSTSLIVVNGNLDISYLNESAENLACISLNRARHLSLHDVLEWDELLKDAIKKTLDGSAPVYLSDYEMSLIKSLSSRRMDVTLTAIWMSPDQWGPNQLGAGPGDRAGQQPLMQYVVMECHESGQAEREHQARSRQHTTLTMVRGLAHEIRNPLGGMRGAAQLLSQELDDSGSSENSLKSYADIIIKEVDRLSSLVERMQSSNLPSSEADVNIHSVLEHVRRLTERKIPEGISIATDYDPSLPDVTGDPERLTQALLNILENAVEALENEGWIRLVTRINHRVIDDDRRQVVKVSIENNGPAISASMIDHIFEPMVSSKTSGGGLGLAITEDIIRQHKGSIDVESNDQKTTFHLFLKTGEPHG